MPVAPIWVYVGKSVGSEKSQ